MGSLSLISGWYFVSRKYPAQHKLANGKQLFNSIGLGSSVAPFSWLPVTHSASVQVNEHGLGISTGMLFRFLSPPIFIPWTALESYVESKVFFRTCVCIRLKEPKRQFFFYGDLAREVLSYRQQMP